MTFCAYLTHYVSIYVLHGSLRTAGILTLPLVVRYIKQLSYLCNLTKIFTIKIFVDIIFFRSILTQIYVLF